MYQLRPFTWLFATQKTNTQSNHHDGPKSFNIITWQASLPLRPHGRHAFRFPFNFTIPILFNSFRTQRYSNATKIISHISIQIHNFITILATPPRSHRRPVRHHLRAPKDALRRAHLTHEAHVAGEVGLG